MDKSVKTQNFCDGYKAALNKVCDWIENEAHWEYYIDNRFPLEKIIEDLKKFMEK